MTTTRGITNRATTIRVASTGATTISATATRGIPNRATTTGAKVFVRQLPALLNILSVDFVVTLSDTLVHEQTRF